jgi:hypothetical protein
MSLLGCPVDGPESLRSAVGVDDVDANPTPADTAHHCPQRCSSTSTPADYLTEIIGMDVYFEGTASPGSHQLDAHIIGVVHDSPHEMLKCIRQHAHTWPSAAAAVSSRSSDPADASSDELVSTALAAP